MFFPILLALVVLPGAASVNKGNAFITSPTSDSSELVPVANDDTYIVYEGTTLTISAPGILENDTGATEVSLVSAPTHGTLMLNADGSFTYEHDGLTTADDSFTYSATDGTQSSTGTVTLDVLPISFGVSSLEGHSLNKPTSLDFGPDSINLLHIPKYGNISNLSSICRY